MYSKPVYLCTMKVLCIPPYSSCIIMLIISTHLAAFIFFLWNVLLQRVFGMDIKVLQDVFHVCGRWAKHVSDSKGRKQMSQGVSRAMYSLVDHKLRPQSEMKEHINQLFADWKPKAAVELQGTLTNTLRQIERGDFHWTKRSGRCTGSSSSGGEVKRREEEGGSEHQDEPSLLAKNNSGAESTSVEESANSELKHLVLRRVRVDHLMRILEFHRVKVFIRQARKHQVFSWIPDIPGLENINPLLLCNSTIKCTPTVALTEDAHLAFQLIEAANRTQLRQRFLGPGEDNRWASSLNSITCPIRFEVVASISA